ncbi:uncharacterized protein N7515_009630 [Penicillium bovifimosum]|uniref:Uncharacterized protein n=1 Tax=Penicillium bovifimosum TaxID=126998 RepID=A0A9W9GJW5_9EURO|nr:uncharacterized protein N7515_009630 [Penicillium bovifimosum]KAJ5121669.1 hypothetical protein N7515_009630 [Penicillium bovifimosum]
MDCFRQIFRCLKGPFRREKGRVIEIGPPTNFRKEELPACFSDAESVLSPILQNPTERSNLTNQSQYADVPEKLHGDRGEGRNNHRDGISTDIHEEQGTGPCSKDERETVTIRLRERLRLSRARKPNTDTGHEIKAPVETIKAEEVRTAELACSED